MIGSCSTSSAAIASPIASEPLGCAITVNTPAILRAYPYPPVNDQPRTRCAACYERRTLSEMTMDPSDT